MLVLALQAQVSHGVVALLGTLEERFLPPKQLDELQEECGLQRVRLWRNIGLRQHHQSIFLL
jgi:hypothetical protein